MPANNTLIIQHGDLPSLAAAGVHPTPRTAVLWHPTESGPNARLKQACVERIGAVLNVVKVELGPTIPTPSSDDDPKSVLGTNLMLLQAIDAARRFDCSRVIWPKQVGPDFLTVGEAVERAEQVSALSLLGLGRALEIPIDLPLIDLSDTQIVEVAADTGLALNFFWPGGPDSSEGADRAGVPDVRHPEAHRWHNAFQQAERTWPWKLENADSAAPTA